ncbi:MAG: methyltransferase domain-containing protein [Pseudomonadota bacterium]
MFDIQQRSYKDELARIAQDLGGPSLQIGSRTQVIDRKAGNHITWRDRLPADTFTGADLEAGENVDAQFDITWDLARIHEALPGPKAFDTIICAHVLEHVRDPFRAARNITNLLLPGGTAFIQVPWVQAFHDFPDDFWRISFSGLQILFGDLVTTDAWYSGGSSDVCYRITRDGNPAVDVEALKLEAQVFQLLLPQPANQDLLKKLNTSAYLSRAYMPVTVLTWIAKKPEAA